MTYAHKVVPEPFEHMPSRVRRLPFPLGRSGWAETEWASGPAQAALATAWELRVPGKGEPRSPLAVVEIVRGGVRYCYAFTSHLGGRFLNEGEVALVSAAMVLVQRQLRRHVCMGTYWHAWSNLRRDPPMLWWPS